MSPNNSSSMPSDPPPAEEIQHALDVLHEPGQVVELRALDVSTPPYRRPHTVSGYFDDMGTLAEAGGRTGTASLKAQIVFGQSRHRGCTKFGRGRLWTNDELFQDCDVPVDHVAAGHSSDLIDDQCRIQLTRVGGGQ